MAAEHTPLDESTTQTQLGGDYRGRGDSTVEHRPEDDAVLITDGGTNLDARVTCEWCGAVSPAGETAPPANCAGGTVFENEHQWRHLATDGGFECLEDVADLETGDEIAVSYRAISGEREGMSAETTGVVSSVDSTISSTIVVFASESGSVRRIRVWANSTELQSLGDNGGWWTFGRDVEVRMASHEQATLATDGGQTLAAFDAGTPGVIDEQQSDDVEPRDVDFGETTSAVELSPPRGAGEEWAAYDADGVLRTFEGYSCRRNALRDMNESGGADA